MFRDAFVLKIHSKKYATRNAPEKFRDFRETEHWRVGNLKEELFLRLSARCLYWVKKIAKEVWDLEKGLNTKDGTISLRAPTLQPHRPSGELLCDVICAFDTESLSPKPLGEAGTIRDWKEQRMCPLYPQTAEVAVRLLNKLFDLTENLKLLIIFYSIIQFVGFISRPVRCHLFHHSGVCRLLSCVCSCQPPICKPHKELWVKPQTEMSPSCRTRLLQDNITELRKKISRLINVMLALDSLDHLHLMLP